MFTRQNKNLIKDKLRCINNTDIQRQIYILLKQDVNFKCTNNSNGIYFNINVLCDDTLSKISDVLKIPEKHKVDKLIYTTYFLEEYNNDDANSFISRRELNKLKECV